MATVYRVFCEHCLRWPKPPLADILPATHDGEEYGAVMPPGFLALRLDNGRLQPLVAPFVDAKLREHGFTMTRARKTGRLARVDFLLCRVCGTLSRSVLPDRSNRLLATALIGVAIAVMPFWWWPGLNASTAGLMGIALGCGAAAGTWFAGDWWRQRCLVRRPQSPCKQCERREFVTLPQAAGRPWMCPHCRHRDLWCRAAGVGLNAIALTEFHPRAAGQRKGSQAGGCFGLVNAACDQVAGLAAPRAGPADRHRFQTHTATIRARLDHPENRSTRPPPVRESKGSDPATHKPTAP